MDYSDKGKRVCFKLITDTKLLCVLNPDGNEAWHSHLLIPPQLNVEEHQKAKTGRTCGLR